MNTDTPNKADEDLRTKAIRYVNKVCNSHPLAYTDRDAIDDLMLLINSEVLALLDRLEAVNTRGMIIDPSEATGVLVAVHRIDVQAAIEAERKRYE